MASFSVFYDDKINLNEEEIIKGCKSGKRKAQDALVQKYAGSLMPVCVRYTKNRNLAQDALQETFINIFKYIHSYAGSGSFIGWMKRIAVNCSLSFNKKINKGQFYVDLDDTSINHSEVPDIYSTLGKEEILNLLHELPDSMYTIFNLSVIEEYNHKEISKILNISEKTSRATLSRARARLANIITRAHQFELKRLDSVSVGTE